MLLDALRQREPPASAPDVRNVTTVQSLMDAGISFPGGFDAPATSARKLSTVTRCIDILSDSMAKLPTYALDTRTRERVHLPILRLLNVRPNEAMTPSIRKKMLEINRQEGGNAFEWVIRDRRSGQPVELVPIPWRLMQVKQDIKGNLWYDVTHPWTGEVMRLPQEDVLHYKNYAPDGIKGISTLSRAAVVINASLAAQEYDKNFFANGGRPSGVLTVDTDLGGYADVPQLDGSVKRVSDKDVLRQEWDRVHSGPSNAHRIAILDHGLKYQSVAISQSDAQFVERQELSVRDLARFFGIPLYKLNEGKQAYGSNEQNALEYVGGTLHPIVTQYEEEHTYKLLPDSVIDKGIELRINMMAELKGDSASRATWYQAMRQEGVYSINDIRKLEDMPDVEGGDEHKESLNFVPASMWKELSINRNQGGERK